MNRKEELLQHLEALQNDISELRKEMFRINLNQEVYGFLSEAIGKVSDAIQVLRELKVFKLG